MCYGLLSNPYLNTWPPCWLRSVISLVKRLQSVRPGFRFCREKGWVLGSGKASHNFLLVHPCSPPSPFSPAALHRQHRCQWFSSVPAVEASGSTLGNKAHTERGTFLPASSRPGSGPSKGATLRRRWFDNKRTNYRLIPLSSGYCLFDQHSLPESSILRPPEPGAGPAGHRESRAPFWGCSACLVAALPACFPLRKSVEGD